MTTTQIIVAVVAIIVIAAIVSVIYKQQRTKALKGRFGPEYDRAVDSYGGQGRAESVLAKREKRVEKLDLHPLTLAGVRIAQAVNLFRYARTASVEKRFLRDLAADAAVPITSIYSKSDGIVHWEACLRPDVEAVEVDGSHVGLGVNREVYAVLARLLAERASRRRKPAPVH